MLPHVLPGSGFEVSHRKSRVESKPGHLPEEEQRNAVSCDEDSRRDANDFASALQKETIRARERQNQYERLKISPWESFDLQKNRHLHALCPAFHVPKIRC